MSTLHKKLGIDGVIGSSEDQPSRGRKMFGWTGFKYRTEVIVNIHSILFFIPELKKLLKTFPKLKQAAGDFRKAGKTELEAAYRQ